MEVVTKDMLIQALALNYEETSKAFVKKDGAKVLSTNDFTDALKAKLDGITEASITEDEVKALFNKGDG